VIALGYQKTQCLSESKTPTKAFLGGNITLPPLTKTEKPSSFAFSDLLKRVKKQSMRTMKRDLCSVHYTTDLTLVRIEKAPCSH
jgi:hypothetical protein